MFNRHRLHILSGLLLAFVFNSTVLGYSGGDGGPGNPWQIASTGDLLYLASHPADYSACFVLTADINLLDSIFSQALIAPDTNLTQSQFQGTPFTGSFDGAGFSIIGLRIQNSGGQDYLGLFGRTENAQIMNLQLKNVSINAAGVSSSHVGALAGNQVGGTIIRCGSSGAIATGGRGRYVGGLAGSVSIGKVLECFSTASVNGELDSVNLGGLTGLLTDSGTIENCYSWGQVGGSGCSGVGGLSGWIENGYAEACYSTGYVNGSSFVGGLVGQLTTGKVINCLWDVKTSGTEYSAAGEGAPTKYMKTSSLYLDRKWDFSYLDGDPAEWILWNEEQDYPVLTWQPPLFAGGLGTTENPWLIQTADHLLYLGFNPDYYENTYQLIADIDMKGIVLDHALIAPDTDPFTADFQGTPFSGDLDGNGHKIRNLTITAPDCDYVGLFGYISNSLSSINITNLVIENASVSGREYTGCIAGFMNNGNIIKCYVQASVSCKKYGGGAVGSTEYGMIEQTASAGSIQGDTFVGGLAGDSVYTSLINCYNTASVNGQFYIGGLAGRLTGSQTPFNHFGNISTCHSIGRINENPIDPDLNCVTGALIGNTVNNPSMFSCFWNLVTTANLYPVGSGQTSSTLKALMPDQMACKDFFIVSGWDFVGESTNGTEDLWTMSPAGYPVLACHVMLDLNAVEITPGTSRTGTTSGSGGIDITRNGYNDTVDTWYYFDPAQDGRYTLTVDNANFDTTLAVFDEDAREIVFNDDFFGGKSCVILKAKAARRYFIRVAGYDGQTGSFTLCLNAGAVQVIQGDLNYDGNVDLMDLSLMAQNWLIEI